MCGIVGYFSAAPVDFQDKLTRSLHDLRHRGPDDEGVWFSDDQKVGLGHRRLSIIDLSKGASQPFVSDEHKISLVFNGEIYNYAEIKSELMAISDYTWHTNSDTEVILLGYLHWGKEFVHKLRGMFAMAIWDLRIGKLLIFRDRIGIKPIYYSMNGSQFTFASEVKPVLNFLPNRKIDNHGLVDYLMNRASIGPRTLIKDVFKLEPGHSLEVSLENNALTVREETYYNIFDQHSGRENNISYEDAKQSIKQTLIDSIRYRYVADVPVCVMLSGGVDSSLIAAISVRELGLKPVCFNVGLKNDDRDETPFAKIAAKALNVDLHTLYIDTNDISRFHEWMFYNDDLNSDPSAFAMFLISEKIHNMNFKVVLTGEGADEIFGGYDSYETYKNKFAANSGKQGNQLLSKLFQTIFSTFPYGYFEKQVTNKYGPDISYFSQAAINTSLSANCMLTDQALTRFFNDAHEKKFGLPANSREALDYGMFVDLNNRIPNDLLIRTDRSTMAFGLEARVPFLDHHLVNESLKLPLEYLFGPNLNQRKTIIRDMAKQYFPAEFIDRQKTGFTMPVNNWLRSDIFRAEINGFLQTRNMSAINYNFMSKLWKMFLDGYEGQYVRIFNWYLLESYFKKWSLEN